MKKEYLVKNLKKIVIILYINLFIFISFTISSQATAIFIDGFNVDVQDNQSTAITFNNDGTKMFVIGGITKKVLEYTLATGFDVSTAQFVDGFDLSNEDTNNVGLAFNSNGTKMFVMGVNSDAIHQYNLSTGFDVSTASFAQSKDVSNEVTQAKNLKFNSDGSKLFLVEVGPRWNISPDDSRVLEYHLTTPFDISTATYDSRFITWYQETQPTGLAFNSNGTKMFVYGNTGDDINEYSLSTGFDISTASFVNNFTDSSLSDVPEDLTFSSDGTKMFALVRRSPSLALVNEYSLSSAFNLLNPTLSSSSPADGATDVSESANIILNFSESVDVESGDITIKKTSDDSTVETIDVTSGLVTGSGSSQITVNPSTTLDSSTEYYVLIDATAFDDSSSNSYAGISSTTALSFTTGDNTSPTLSSSTPADDASDVSRDANIILNFSESVDVESGNITIKKTSDDSAVETIDVTSSQVTGTGTSQITINPSSDFIGGSEYYILIDATAFDDNEGNSYAGISSTTALSFIVGDMQDPTKNKDVVGLINSQVNISKSYVQQSINIISNRLNYLKQNRSNSNLSSKNIKLDFFGNAMLNALSEAIQIANKSSKEKNQKKWSSWSEGVIVVSKSGDSEDSSSFKIDSGGVAIGFDRLLNENDFIGFAFQLAQSDSEIGSSGTSIDSENLNISFYRSNPLDNDNFIEGLIGFGLLENDLVRKSGSNTLTGSRNGAQVFGSINFGKKIDKGNLSLTPVASLDLAYTELSAYSETGTDALSYSKQIIESGLASIGLEVGDIIEFNNSFLKPFGSVEYSLDFSNSSDAKMNYTSDTSTIYTYKQGINSNHFISSEIGFEYMTSDNLNIIASYMRTQGNESQHTDQVRLQANYSSKKETEYAMILEGSNDFVTGFEISKNLSGFDLNFNANQSLYQSSSRAAEISILKKY